MSSLFLHLVQDYCMIIRIKNGLYLLYLILLKVEKTEFWESIPIFTSLIFLSLRLFERQQDTQRELSIIPQQPGLQRGGSWLFCPGLLLWLEGMWLHDPDIAIKVPSQALWNRLWVLNHQATCSFIPACPLLSLFCSIDCITITNILKLLFGILAVGSYYKNSLPLSWTTLLLSHFQTYLMWRECWVRVATPFLHLWTVSVISSV